MKSKLVLKGKNKTEDTADFNFYNSVVQLIHMSYKEGRDMSTHRLVIDSNELITEFLNIKDLFKIKGYLFKEVKKRVSNNGMPYDFAELDSTPNTLCIDSGSLRCIISHSSENNSIKVKVTRTGDDGSGNIYQRKIKMCTLFGCMVWDIICHGTGEVTNNPMKIVTI